MMVVESSSDWSDLLRTAVGLLDWKRGTEWEGTAMSGKRVNNTGPGINATAEYIFQHCGVGAAAAEQEQPAPVAVNN